MVTIERNARSVLREARLAEAYIITSMDLAVFTTANHWTRCGQPGLKDTQGTLRYTAFLQPQGLGAASGT